MVEEEKGRQELIPRKIYTLGTHAALAHHQAMPKPFQHLKKEQIHLLPLNAVSSYLKQYFEHDGVLIRHVLKHLKKE